MILPLAGAAALLLGQTDAGYVRERTTDHAHCLRWPVTAPARKTLTFVQSSQGDPALVALGFDAVSNARQTWEAQSTVCGSLDLVEGAHSSSRFIGYSQSGSNENLVLFRTQDCGAVVASNDPCHNDGSCGNAHDCWDHGAGTLALTTSTYTADDGVLVDADIEINAASAHPTVIDPPAPTCSGGNFSLCIANDVQNTVTHEFGHVLGLDHSPDPTSTMYATEPLGETSKRILDPGSERFVCEVYPAGLASQDCLLSDGGTDPGGAGGGNPSGGGGPNGPGVSTGTTGCSSGPSAAGGLGLLALVLLPLLAFRRVR
jgi:hypothetical protein